MEKAAFDQEVNAKKAEAQLAYQLQVCAYIYLTGLFLLNAGSNIEKTYLNDQQIHTQNTYKKR